jgi:hypothetical protein
MGGYQSDSGGGNSINFLRNKGFLRVVENRPFPSGQKNDVWIIECDDESGQVGAMFTVENGDIILCIKDNPGGNFIVNAWLVIPRTPDIIEEVKEEDENEGT